MPTAQNPRARDIIFHPGRFALSVIRTFRKNQGLLLSGAVAYYSLLSIIPLFSLLLIGLSQLVAEDALLATVKEFIALLLPGQADALEHEIAVFLSHRDVVGWIGVGVMLFFSTMAFSVLESAMDVIFHHRVRKRSRHPLVSAALPYVFISLLGVGLLVVTVVSALLQTWGERGFSFMHRNIRLDALSGPLTYLGGVAGLILMLTAIYLVLPRGRISLRHALVGGVAAGVLWELSRHVLVWYYSTLSMVNVIYGSLATVIVALLSLEIAGMILLLGAQVIAEYERYLAGELDLAHSRAPPPDDDARPGATAN